MELNNVEIKEILLRGNYATGEDIKKGDEYARFHHSSLVDYLLEKGLITRDLLGQAVAEYFGVSYGDLNSNQPPREQVLEIPEATAKKYRIVIFKKEAEKKIVATDNPRQSNLQQILINIFPAQKIEIAYSLPEDIDRVFINYHKALEARFAKIVAASRRVAPGIIDEIIKDAVDFRASDIHFEPQEKEIIIRFRIDGVLHETGRLSNEHYENILNRIKVQAHLRTDEHLAAQDGSIRYDKDGKTIDLRVSIAPTLDGEKIVIRILAEYFRGFTLNDLGLSPKNQELVTAASQKPFGMILTAGPTGAGKTTTLYGILKFLNREEVNIATIEDPVEYKIPGVNHIQVNPQTNLTFASGLKSIVRQDPDIVLVGEIRDWETADLAVNAGLTGHLMLSTLHANDAATAIPRLLDMKVEPFLLASTLELVIAQRLVRRICEECRYSYQENIEEIGKYLTQAEKYFPEKNVTLYRGKGCNACAGTGYKGRIAIFELIQASTELQDLILKNPSTKQIWELARKNGAISMFEDGIEKVKFGVTTLEEVMRISKPPLIQ
jgi:type II secretory ATPase GspE/PulE/Tfp pilus assembly ATPase PilB-like protein